MVQFLVLGNDQLSTAAASNKYPQEASKMVICGSGSFVISAAKIDHPRMKAITTVSMYDMGAATVKRSNIP